MEINETQSIQKAAFMPGKQAETAGVVAKAEPKLFEVVDDTNKIASATAFDTNAIPQVTTPPVQKDDDKLKEETNKLASQGAGETAGVIASNANVNKNNETAGVIASNNPNSASGSSSAVTPVSSGGFSTMA